MRRNEKRRAPASILLPVAFCVGFAVLFIAKAMPFLPKGEQLLRVASPGGDRVVNAYLCDGGATVDYAIRCEVEGAALSGAICIGSIIRRRLSFAGSITIPSASTAYHST